MKRKICIAFTFLFVGFITHAQTGSLVTTELPGVIKNALIREYQTDHSISYIQTAGGCYFAWSDNLLTINLVEIDCQYKVNDFEIYGDTVCFCGTDGTDGFVGWFSIPDLFSGANGFYLYHSFNTNHPPSFPPYLPAQSHVSNFKDLTIFENIEDPSGRVHVALVGEDATGTSCVTLLQGFFGTNTWSYTTGTPDIVAGTTDHIVSTDQYIVTAGYTQDQVCISLRVFHKTAFFSSFLGDTEHKYSWFLYPECVYPIGSFAMTAMDGDTLATTSLFTTDNSAPLVNGFVTHVFDAYSTAYDPIGTSNIDNRLVYIQNGTSKRSVNSLTYSHLLKTLAGLVWSNNPLSVNSSLMGEIHWPFTMTMDYYTKNDYYFFNHDTYFLQAGYIAMGKDEVQPNTLAIFSRHLATTGNPYCGLGGSATTEKGSFRKKDDYFPLTCITNPFQFGKVTPLGMKTYKLDLKCIEP